MSDKTYKKIELSLLVFSLLGGGGWMTVMHQGQNEIRRELSTKPSRLEVDTIIEKQTPYNRDERAIKQALESLTGSQRDLALAVNSLQSTNAVLVDKLQVAPAEILLEVKRVDGRVSSMESSFSDLHESVKSLEKRWK